MHVKLLDRLLAFIFLHQLNYPISTKITKMKYLKMLMMTALTIFTISVFAQQTTGFKKKTSKQQSAKVSYYFPMHLDKVSGKSGKCSKCGTTLNLTPKKK